MSLGDYINNGNPDTEDHKVAVPEKKRYLNVVHYYTFGENAYEGRCEGEKIAAEIDRKYDCKAQVVEVVRADFGVLTAFQHPIVQTTPEKTKE
jgi:hypothetical protein